MLLIKINMWNLMSHHSLGNNSWPKVSKATLVPFTPIVFAILQNSKCFITTRSGQAYESSRGVKTSSTTLVMKARILHNTYDRDLLIFNNIFVCLSE